MYVLCLRLLFGADWGGRVALKIALSDERIDDDLAVLQCDTLWGEVKGKQSALGLRIGHVALTIPLRSYLIVN